MSNLRRFGLNITAANAFKRGCLKTLQLTLRADRYVMMMWGCRRAAVD